ncbi:MAG TPA: hypothetical protein VFG68_23785, partial [Fimbriiglobus sp.]|nr:hypothetical protein [Fimbriiglobus sp.]
LLAPLAIAGSSATSAGGHILSGREAPVIAEFRQLSDKCGRQWHVEVPPDASALEAVLYDSYLWARDLLGWPADFPALAGAKAAESARGWFVHGKELTCDWLPGGCHTVADAARVCHWFTGGTMPPEVQIEELRAEVVRAVRIPAR